MNKLTELRAMAAPLFHGTLLLAAAGLVAQAFIAFDGIERGASLHDELRFQGDCAPLGPAWPRGTSAYARLRVGTGLAQDGPGPLRAVVSCRKGTAPRALA